MAKLGDEFPKPAGVVNRYDLTHKIDGQLKCGIPSEPFRP
jgi:hypothetical protein